VDGNIDSESTDIRAYWSSKQLAAAGGAGVRIATEQVEVVVSAPGSKIPQ